MAQNQHLAPALSSPCFHGISRIEKGSLQYNQISMFCIETENSEIMENQKIDFSLESLDKLERFCRQKHEIMHYEIARILHSMAIDAILLKRNFDAVNMFYKRSLLIQLCINFDTHLFWTTPSCVSLWRSQVLAANADHSILLQLLDANTPCNCLKPLLKPIILSEYPCDSSLSSLSRILQYPKNINSFTEFHIELREETSSLQSSCPTYICLVINSSLEKLCFSFPFPSKKGKSYRISQATKLLFKVFKEFLKQENLIFRPHQITVRDPVLYNLLLLVFREKEILIKLIDRNYIPLNTFNTSKYSSSSSILFIINKISNELKLNSIVLFCCFTSCGKLNSGKLIKCCSACKNVYYCNKECQRLDWKISHKMNCKKGIVKKEL